MNLHEDLVLEYGRLEQAVGNCMAALCRAACSRCDQVCCRVDFCRESLESVFLSRVRDFFAPQADWDPQLGWLTPYGCGLAAGRPPVCYEFVCRTLEDRVPTSQHREALRGLARVITEAGVKAGGKMHLVEMHDLSRLNRKRLAAQLERARITLADLRRFWGCSHPAAATHDYCLTCDWGGDAPSAPSL